MLIFGGRIRLTGGHWLVPKKMSYRRWLRMFVFYFGTVELLLQDVKAVRIREPETR